MVTMQPITGEYSQAILDIFNDYVATSDSTFFDRPVPVRYFEEFIGITKGLPTVIALEGENVLGFATLQPYSPFRSFSKTAEITFYVKKTAVRRGIGKWMVDYLYNQAKHVGIEMFLSSVSSRNQASIAFHQAMGFAQCGHFVQIAEKNGQKFDVYWFQKKVI